MFIDLNNKLCFTKPDKMFDWDILNINTAQILDVENKHVNTNKVAANQKQLNIN